MHLLCPALVLLTLMNSIVLTVSQGNEMKLRSRSTRAMMADADRTEDPEEEAIWERSMERNKDGRDIRKNRHQENSWLENRRGNFRDRGNGYTRKHFRKLSRVRNWTHGNALNKEDNEAIQQQRMELRSRFQGRSKIQPGVRMENQLTSRRTKPDEEASSLEKRLADAEKSAEKQIKSAELSKFLNDVEIWDKFQSRGGRLSDTKKDYIERNGVSIRDEILEDTDKFFSGRRMNGGQYSDYEELMEDMENGRNEQSLKKRNAISKRDLTLIDDIGKENEGNENKTNEETGKTQSDRTTVESLKELKTMVTQMINQNTQEEGKDGETAEKKDIDGHQETLRNRIANSVENFAGRKILSLRNEMTETKDESPEFPEKIDKNLLELFGSRSVIQKREVEIKKKAFEKVENSRADSVAGISQDPMVDIKKEANYGNYAGLKQNPEADKERSRTILKRKATNTKIKSTKRDENEWGDEDDYYDHGVQDYYIPKEKEKKREGYKESGRKEKPVTSKGKEFETDDEKLVEEEEKEGFKDKNEKKKNIDEDKKDVNKFSKFALPRTSSRTDKEALNGLNNKREMDLGSNHLQYLKVLPLKTQESPENPPGFEHVKSSVQHVQQTFEKHPFSSPADIEASNFVKMDRRTYKQIRELLSKLLIAGEDSQAVADVKTDDKHKTEDLAKDYKEEEEKGEEDVDEEEAEDEDPAGIKYVKSSADVGNSNRHSAHGRKMKFGKHKLRRRDFQSVKPYKNGHLTRELGRTRELMNAYSKPFTDPIKNTHSIPLTDARSLLTRQKKNEFGNEEESGENESDAREVAEVEPGIPQTGSEVGENEHDTREVAEDEPGIPQTGSEVGENEHDTSIVAGNEPAKAETGSESDGNELDDQEVKGDEPGMFETNLESNENTRTTRDSKSGPLQFDLNIDDSPRTNGELSDVLLRDMDVLKNGRREIASDKGKVKLLLTVEEGDQHQRKKRSVDEPPTSAEFQQERTPRRYARESFLKRSPEIRRSRSKENANFMIGPGYMAAARTAKPKDRFTEDSTRDLGEQIIQVILNRVEKTTVLNQILGTGLFPRTTPLEYSSSGDTSRTRPSYSQKLQELLQKVVVDLEALAEDDLKKRTCLKISNKQKAFLHQNLDVQDTPLFKTLEGGRSVEMKNNTLGRHKFLSSRTLMRGELLKNRAVLVQLISQYRSLSPQGQLVAKPVYKKLLEKLQEIEHQINDFPDLSLNHKEKPSVAVHRTHENVIFVKPMIYVPKPKDTTIEVQPFAGSQYNQSYNPDSVSMKYDRTENNEDTFGQRIPERKTKTEEDPNDPLINNLPESVQNYLPFIPLNKDLHNIVGSEGIPTKTDDESETRNLDKEKNPEPIETNVESEELETTPGRYKRDLSDDQEDQETVNLHVYLAERKRNALSGNVSPFDTKQGSENVNDFKVLVPRTGLQEKSDPDAELDYMARHTTPRVRRRLEMVSWKEPNTLLSPEYLQLLRYKDDAVERKRRTSLQDRIKEIFLVRPSMADSQHPSLIHDPNFMLV